MGGATGFIVMVTIILLTRLDMRSLTIGHMLGVYKLKPQQKSLLASYSYGYRNRGCWVASVSRVHLEDPPCFAHPLRMHCERSKDLTLESAVPDLHGHLVSPFYLVIST